MKSTTPLSKREWILLIVILLLIQFVIHWLALKYGNSVSALGYVSFAGTVVSILLGLIAIIYAFVQSFTQASSVVEIREQIDKLIMAGDDIVKSKDDLHRSALELSGITDELSNKLGESILASREVAGSVIKLSDAFASQKPAVDSTSSQTGTNGEGLSIFSSTKILAAVMVSAIAEGVKRDFMLNDIKKLIAIPLGEKIGYHSEFMSGLFFMTIYTLEAEGFATISAGKDKKWEIKCTEDFFEKTEKAFPRSNSSEYKELLAFWSFIDSLE